MLEFQLQMRNFWSLSNDVKACTLIASKVARRDAGLCRLQAAGKAGSRRVCSPSPCSQKTCSTCCIRFCAVQSNLAKLHYGMPDSTSCVSVLSNHQQMLADTILCWAAWDALMLSQCRCMTVCLHMSEFQRLSWCWSMFAEGFPSSK